MRLRILFVTLAVILFCSMANSQTLNLEVRGFEKISGVLYIGFYNSSGTFLKKAVFGMKLNVSNINMKIPCTGLATGTYAISLFQDDNGNNTLDKGAFGIPQEKYGFSNSNSAYGPPTFDKSKFRFRKDTTVIINLH